MAIKKVEWVSSSRNPTHHLDSFQDSFNATKENLQGITDSVSKDDISNIQNNKHRFGTILKGLHILRKY